MSQATLEKTTNELKSYLRQAQKAGRRKSIPISLPKPNEVEIEDRPKLARLRVEMQSDLLGLKRGEYDQRPKITPDMVTPERLSKAKQAGGRIVTEKETFEDGRPTGLQHKRFKGILEVWKERKVIDDETFAAAQEFQRDCDLSLEASPRMISRYGSILPRGIPDLLPQEIQIEFEKRKQNAIKSVDSRLHFILGWIAEVSNADVHPDTVAEQYWPKRSEKTRIERFKALLEYTCMILSVHYGLSKHRWVKLSASKAAQEIYDLLNPV